MKKSILLQVLLSVALLADITLTKEEEKNWQIQTLVAKEVSYVPVGEYIMSVVTPPTLLHALSVPFSAQVVHLNKVNYETIKKGESLALLTSTEWIQAQKKAIADAIELIHHSHLAERKTKLCAQEIIAQKECIAADAEVKTDKIKQLASQRLLKAYGASDKLIKRLYKELTISANLELVSPVKGRLIEVNIQPGKSIAPLSALFLIKLEGANWLESDLPLDIASKLQAFEKVVITINKKEITSTVLQLSPIINTRNQTRHIRFSLAKDVSLLPGLRQTAQLSIKRKALIVNKNAVVQDGEHSIVFIKKDQKYFAQRVTVITENLQETYLEFNPVLQNPVVISTTSVLQNMLHKGE